ncbi:uncharacterized protein LOC118906926 isoform X2 [Balaenoptera musculus]|uniref:Uncharacterized protein LOC118906926 isoform X2 n=1 Tax=Balaenoptera musculus TaxID=9771 RepID=A0A8B8Z7G0_BALMU|nr:uncharacterized protein LOC118906926 isoform X2 [Balaenoptera musculus]
MGEPPHLSPPCRSASLQDPSAQEATQATAPWTESTRAHGLRSRGLAALAPAAASGLAPFPLLPPLLVRSPHSRNPVPKALKRERQPLGQSHGPRDLLGKTEARVDLPAVECCSGLPQGRGQTFSPLRGRRRHTANAGGALRRFLTLCLRKAEKKQTRSQKMRQTLVTWITGKNQGLRVSGRSRKKTRHRFSAYKEDGAPGPPGPTEAGVAMCCRGGRFSHLALKPVALGSVLGSDTWWLSGLCSVFSVVGILVASASQVTGRTAWVARVAAPSRAWHVAHGMCSTSPSSRCCLPRAVVSATSKGIEGGAWFRHVRWWRCTQPTSWARAAQHRRCPWLELAGPLQGGPTDVTELYTWPGFHVHGTRR